MTGTQATMVTTGSRKSVAVLFYGVRAKSYVAKRGSGSDTGMVGHRRSDGNGHTTGIGGALYSATEAPAEVPTGDNSSCMADRAERGRAGIRRANPRGNGDIGAEETSASSGDVAEATSRAAFRPGGSWSGVR